MKSFAGITLLLVICLLALVGCSDEATTPKDDENGGGTPTYGFNLYRYGSEFQGIWMFSATEWIAVCDEGAILHFKDGDVYSMASGVLNDLNDIWAAGPNNIFVVGESYQSQGGAILHYDGSSWSQMTHTVQEDINGVYGFTATDVYAVTSDSLVIHYDGTSWTQAYQRPSPGALYDVWCSGLTNVVAVGENGGIVRWDGASWSDDSVIGDDFTSVWGSAYNNIYVCGGEQILLYDGTWGLAHVEAGVNFEEIHGSGANDVWAVGPDELVFHWNGTEWLPSSAGSGGNGNDFHAVWGWSGTNAILLSDHGGVYQYDGSAWNEINNSGQGRWSDMHGVSADVIYAVSGKTLMRWDGTRWAEESNNSDYNIAVWCAAEDAVWTCGWPGPGTLGYIYYYNGSTWSQEYSIDRTMPQELWGDGTGHIFAVWEEGIVSEYDGTPWSHSTVTSPPVNLNAVWGASATDVFVVGRGGTIYRLQGTAWSQMVSGVDPGIELSAVWGTSATDVVAVGEVGTIVRFDGANWTAEDGGTTVIMNAVWADAPDNYWVVGMSGTVLHYDGSSWTKIPTGLSDDIRLDCVWGSGGNDVWVGGDNEYLMHYEQR